MFEAGSGSMFDWFGPHASKLREQAATLIAVALAAALLFSLASAMEVLNRPEPAPGLSAADAQAEAKAEEAFGNIPAVFERNVGQADPEVKFLARSGSSTLLLTAHKATVVSPDGQLTMSLVGANKNSRPAATGLLPGVINYLVGADPRLSGTPTLQRRRASPTQRSIQASI